MLGKIERWRLSLPADDPDAWVGEISVTFDRDDLNCLVFAITSSYYEGVITEQEMEHLLEKLKIDGK